MMLLGKVRQENWGDTLGGATWTEPMIEALSGWVCQNGANRVTPRDQIQRNTKTNIPPLLSSHL